MLLVRRLRWIFWRKPWQQWQIRHFDEATQTLWRHTIFSSYAYLHLSPPRASRSSIALAFEIIFLRETPEWYRGCENVTRARGLHWSPRPRAQKPSRQASGRRYTVILELGQVLCFSIKLKKNCKVEHDETKIDRYVSTYIARAKNVRRLPPGTRRHTHRGGAASCSLGTHTSRDMPALIR